MENKELEIISKGESQFEVLEPNTLGHATTLCGDYVVVILNPKMYGLDAKETFEKVAKEVNNKFENLIK